MAQPPASLRDAIVAPLAVAVAALGIVAAGLAWLTVKDHLIADQSAKASHAAIGTVQMAQTIASEDALQRLVQLAASDRAVEQLVVVAGEPLKVIASSRAAWLGGGLARLPDDARADLTSPAGPETLVAGNIVRAVKWFERQSPESGNPQPAAVLVDIDISRERRWIDATALGAAAAVLAALLVIGAITHAVLRRKVIAPVARIGETIARRRAGDAGARVPPLAGDELGSLASELNRALDAEDAARAAAADRERALSDALDELATAKARFEGLLASIPQQVWTASKDGWLDYVSPQLAAFFGVTTDELVGGQWNPFMHPDDVDRAKAAARKCLRSGAPYGVDYRLRRHDGVYRWFSVTAVPIRDANGQIVRWIGSNSDITDRKRADDQIQESQKLEAIGQLAGGLAHDFNNLLGIVVGNLDLMGERLGSDARVRAQHAAALKAALRGSEVTRSLLAVARRQPLEVATHDLHEQISEMLPLLRSSAGSSVEIDTRFAPGALVARLDSAGLANVVLNLVINARDALRDVAGPKRITLRTRSVVLADGCPEGLASGRYAVFEVVDTGSGMSETVARQAFEPFFTTKPLGKGTGLGLSMVRGYAEQLGGTARIESAEGVGTTIRIYLPQAAGTSAEAASEPPAGPDATDEHAATADRAPASSSDGGPAGLRVLVVDDEPGLSELACDWLESLGHRAEGVQSPARALERLAAEPFDILFTDVVMPGGTDGIALAREARRLQPGLQVLITSGYAQGLVHAEELPGTLLTKPYRRVDLSRAIQSLAR